MYCIWLKVRQFSHSILLAVGGERFAPILELLGLKGLYNEETGAYADCSKPENKQIVYCQPKDDSYSQEWKKISRSGKKAYPFRLSE
jgi:hypothetical protein